MVPGYLYSDILSIRLEDQSVAGHWFLAFDQDTGQVDRIYTKTKA